MRSSNGFSIRVYCDMTKICRNETGGLTRVAILNNETLDVRSTEKAGCSNIIFSVMNIPYTLSYRTIECG